MGAGRRADLARGGGDGTFLDSGSLTGKPELVASAPLQPGPRMEIKPLPVLEDGFLPSTVSCWFATLAFGSSQPTQ